MFRSDGGEQYHMQALPEQWREFSAYHRDILFTVYQQGGLVGRDIFETIGECEGRAKPTRFYDRINELEQWGYLRTETADDRPGNSQTWHVTVKGDLLIEQVQEKWRGL